MPSGAPDNRHVRVAALGDLHFGKNSQGTFQAAADADQPGGRGPAGVRRFHRLRHARRGARARPGARRRTCDPRARRARQPRLPRRARGRDHGHPPRRGRDRARRRRARGPRASASPASKASAAASARGALGPWGEDDVQALRAGGGRGGAEARGRARPAAHAVARGRCSTTRRSATPSKASRSRFIRFSDRAASKSRSTATTSRRSSTATRTAAQPEGRTATGVPVYNVSLPLMKALTPERPRSSCSSCPHRSAHERRPNTASSLAGAARARLTREIPDDDHRAARLRLFTTTPG